MSAKSDFDENIRNLNDLRYFLQNAPDTFESGERIKRHELPNSEAVSCIRWDEDFLMSGADILRCVVFRFEALGREVVNRAKFEELVFSDLRSLKTNVRARLEEGKSDMLEFLHQYGCIRTKKKQRVFYWYAIPHEKLFLESLERELRRAMIDNAQSDSHRVTVAVRERALSMPYDPMQKVVNQIHQIIMGSPPSHRNILNAAFGYEDIVAPSVYAGRHAGQPVGQPPSQMAGQPSSQTAGQSPIHTTGQPPPQKSGQLPPQAASQPYSVQYTTHPGSYTPHGGYTPHQSYTAPAGYAHQGGVTYLHQPHSDSHLYRSSPRKHSGIDELALAASAARRNPGAPFVVSPHPMLRPQPDASSLGHPQPLITHPVISVSPQSSLLGTQPPSAQPPSAQPPSAQPPSAQSLSTQPSSTQSLSTQPSSTQPPSTLISPQMSPPPPPSSSPLGAPPPGLAAQPPLSYPGSLAHLPGLYANPSDNERLPSIHDVLPPHALDLDGLSGRKRSS